MNTAQAILLGYLAGCGGIPPHDNPFPAGSDLAAAWDQGNQRAIDEREERLRRWMGRRQRKGKVR